MAGPPLRRYATRGSRCCGAGSGFSAKVAYAVFLRLIQFGSGSPQLLQGRQKPSLQFVELPQTPRFHIAQSDRPAKTSEKNLRHHAHLENVPVSEAALGWSGRGRSIAARRRAE